MHGLCTWSFASAKTSFAMRRAKGLGYSLSSTAMPDRSCKLTTQHTTTA